MSLRVNGGSPGPQGPRQVNGGPHSPYPWGLEPRMVCKTLDTGQRRTVVPEGARCLLPAGLSGRGAATPSRLWCAPQAEETRLRVWGGQGGRSCKTVLQRMDPGRGTPAHGRGSPVSTPPGAHQHACLRSAPRRREGLERAGQPSLGAGAGRVRASQARTPPGWAPAELPALVRSLDVDKQGSGPS